MMPYELQVALWLALFLGIYQLFLRHLTFYRLNRWALLFGVAASFTIPHLTLPMHWVPDLPTRSNATAKIAPSPSTPVIEPAQIDASPEVDPAHWQERDSQQKSVTTGIIGSVYDFLRYQPWKSYFQNIYALGFTIFFLQWILQLLSLIFKIAVNPKKQVGQFKIIDSRLSSIPPCSFGPYIFINPTLYDQETYRQILDHEMVHARQKHSIDVVISSWLVILQWFNPFAWRYAKSIKMNLEFLVDNTMLQQGVPREFYQMSLLEVAVPRKGPALASNYNFSVLKKRISMMNRERSAPDATWKYVTVFLVFAFSVYGMSIYRKANLSKYAGYEEAMAAKHLSDGYRLTDRQIEKLLKEGKEKNIVKVLTVAKESGRKDFLGDQLFRIAQDGKQDGFAQVVAAAQTYDAFHFNGHQLTAITMDGKQKKFEQALIAARDFGGKDLNANHLYTIAMEGKTEGLTRALSALQQFGSNPLNGDHLFSIILEGKAAGLELALEALNDYDRNLLSADHLLGIVLEGKENGLAMVLRALETSGRRDFRGDQVFAIVIEGKAEVLDEIITQDLNAGHLAALSSDELQTLILNGSENSPEWKLIKALTGAKAERSQQ